MANFDYPWLIEHHDDYTYIKFSPIAVKALGELVFLDLPNVGAHLKKGMPSIGIEAENWIGTSKVPVNGIVTAVNQQIVDFKSCHLTSDDWLLKIVLD